MLPLLHMEFPKKYLNRQAEITEHFMQVMNAHMDDFMAGRVEQMCELRDIAAVMCLHPVHVTNVIKAHTGHHPCYFYELRILDEAKQLLNDHTLSIADVARRLTYDSSNFTKWFKRYNGNTPKEFRNQLAGKNASTESAQTSDLHLVA